jgi:hypothetical protein
MQIAALQVFLEAPKKFRVYEGCSFADAFSYYLDQLLVTSYNS